MSVMSVMQSRSHAVMQSRSHAVTQSRSHAVTQSVTYRGDVGVLQVADPIYALVAVVEPPVDRA